MPIRIKDRFRKLKNKLKMKALGCMPMTHRGKRRNLMMSPTERMRRCSMALASPIGKTYHRASLHATSPSQRASYRARPHSHTFLSLEEARMDMNLFRELSSRDIFEQDMQLDAVSFKHLQAEELFLVRNDEPKILSNNVQVGDFMKAPIPPPIPSSGSEPVLLSCGNDLAQSLIIREDKKDDQSSNMSTDKLSTPTRRESSTDGENQTDEPFSSPDAASVTSDQAESSCTSPNMVEGIPVWTTLRLALLRELKQYIEMNKHKFMY